MKKILIAGVVAASGLLSACTSFHAIALPEGTAEKKDISVVNRAPDSDDMFALPYTIPGSTYGVATDKTGSLAVGILLGPVGAAANLAYAIQMAKEAGDEIKDSLPMNISERFKETLASIHPGYRFKSEIADPVNGVRAIPSVNLRIVNGKTIHPSCVLRVAEIKNKSVAWVAYYHAGFPRQFDKEDKAYLSNEFGKDAINCLTQAFFSHRKHVEGKFRPARTSAPNGIETDLMAYADNENSTYYMMTNAGVYLIKQSDFERHGNRLRFLE